MTVSRLVQIIAEAPGAPWDEAAWVGVPCEGSKFHSPRPLLVRPHDLAVGDDPLLPEGDKVNLCATCGDNLSLYLGILSAYDGATPCSVRKDFGNVIRSLGDRAWVHHTKRSAPAPV